MTDAPVPGTSLVLYNEDPSLKRILEISGPIDFLFIGAGTRKFRPQLLDHLTQIGIELGVVTEVVSDLYSSGGTGELAPGLYGIDDIISASLHKFTEIPDPDHPLIIVSNSIRYGRQFREICEVLERYMNRDMYSASVPPTFAFFRRLMHEDGPVRDRNIFTPVGKDLGFNYLPTYVAPYIS